MILFLSVALAEDSAFATTDASVFDEPEADLSAELGGTFAGGNAVYRTVNGALAAGYRWQRNKLSLDGSVAIGQAIIDAEGDGIIDDADRATGLQENARRYQADLRYDRFLTERDALYVLAGAFVDPYAGYDLRAHEQLGYARILVASDATELRAEVGFDVAQEFYVEGIDPATANIYAAKVLLGLTHQLNESVSVAEQVEVYENVIDPADVRVINGASVSAALSDVFSLKVSHALTYDNVPVAGYRPLDQTTMVTFVATLL